MFPGDWGSAPISKMSSPAYSRIAHFLQNFMKFALLAKDLSVTSYGTFLLSVKEYHITSSGRRKTIPIQFRKTVTELFTIQRRRSYWTEFCRNATLKCSEGNTDSSNGGMGSPVDMIEQKEAQKPAARVGRSNRVGTRGKAGKPLQTKAPMNRPESLLIEAHEPIEKTAVNEKA